jgi:hypothetical protein
MGGVHVGEHITDAMLELAILFLLVTAEHQDNLQLDWQARKEARVVAHEVWRRRNYLEFGWCGRPDRQEKMMANEELWLEGLPYERVNCIQQ